MNVAVRKDLSVGDLERAAIDAARARPPAEKLRDGLRLFDRTCEVMAAGIRQEYPDADPARVFSILRERLRLARELERR
jgi:hypothetical protein